MKKTKKPAKKLERGLSLVRTAVKELQPTELTQANGGMMNASAARADMSMAAAARVAYVYCDYTS